MSVEAVTEVAAAEVAEAAAQKSICTSYLEERKTTPHGTV